MNKNDLVAAVARDCDQSVAGATGAVDAIFAVISKALQSGDEVKIAGFGSFSVANRAARSGRNPRTGEAIKIEASRQPKFKAGKALKDVVNGKG